MENAMKMTLCVREAVRFFWLRKIRGVKLQECCAKCFIANKVAQVYHKTLDRPAPYTVEAEMEPEEKFRAYYLCGMSKGFKYENNIHVAFIHAPGELLEIDSPQMALTITNARRIEFEQYVPDPPGEFTAEQRKCRNWIFANYLNDGMIEQPK